MSTVLKVNSWRKESRQVAIANREKGGISTVSSGPESDRCRPDLYKILDELLKKSELPG